ncbi:DMT family transporter [Curvibacter sp. RS43]|uniref:DMT family transporter n=1 Tax=Curvibacter microcysteis TaxID=3026419 RepID=UPI00235F88CD|nr:DMT family transporter [Curvibacter sp. RS43]MDD0811776.1 DMT family transporter [Curvibacter sp. RS43]
MSHHTTTATDLRRGLWLGALGVAIFALTLPMTRLAVGQPDAPLMSGQFLAMGRAVVAAGLSALYLLATRARWPQRDQWMPLLLTSLGVVFGFPLFTSIAMRHVAAMHASVIVGVLPLATAAVGAVLHRQRPSWQFWAWAGVGSALVVTFALTHAGGGGLGLQAADGLLLLAMACAAVGYAYGGRLSRQMPAEHVICWALLIGLPLSAPLAWDSRPTSAMPLSAWGAFAYVAVGSMWLGFFAWYRGLALGGTVRVSQVQLLQPFLSMLFAVPLLGEQLDLPTVLFACAVVATVFAGRKAPVGSPAKTDNPSLTSLNSKGNAS